jgi:hypothetical protein
MRLGTSYRPASKITSCHSRKRDYESRRNKNKEGGCSLSSCFITGGNEADFVMVIAITDKEKHQATGCDGVTCFIVDRDMLEI